MPGSRGGSKALATRGLFAALLCAVGFALLLGACDLVRQPHSRVLLIGIDGASLRVIEPLIAAGRLPHLAEIARRGVSGKLRSAKPIFSPRIWNSIATGRVPEKHGIVDFARSDANGERRLYLASDRKVHALWNIASDAGLTVGVVNWWNTYPLEPVRGVVVSDHAIASETRDRSRIAQVTATPTHDDRVVHPEAWRERVAAMLASTEPVTDLANPFETPSELPANALERREDLAQRFDEDGAITRVALAVEGELHPDLLMVFLPGIDRVSHFLWGTLEAPELYPENLQPTPAQRAAGANALHAYYEYTDALIGLLLERFGSTDLVMVVSDHGFEAGVGFTFLTGVHESDAAIDGVLFARGRDIPEGTQVISVSVNDVTPTVLAWLGLPIAADMDGKRAGFVGTKATEPIATYETSAVERLPAAPSGAEGEMLEQLEALGYFERE